MSLEKGNYYVVQSFMITELKLKGLEKELYAIIWGFSQGKNRFNGSLEYLSEWTGYSERRIITVLQKLVSKGLLDKQSSAANGRRYCSYRAIAPKSVSEGSKTELEIDFDYQMAKDSASSEKAHTKASRGLKWKNKKVEVYKPSKITPYALCGAMKTQNEINKLYEQKETITKEQFAIQRAMLMEKLGGK